MSEESRRLLGSKNNSHWKKWGPYVSERQWGTVREDYSVQGDAWGYTTHDQARSRAYRWGEEGIAGFCDAAQILCFAPAFWNGKDPIIKERLFGLSNDRGNHGEDVKEVYFHLDSTPTYSYCKFNYKYPQERFPYDRIVAQNRRTRLEPEFEVVDTGIFDKNHYWDITIEYAKADAEDILQRITIRNKGSKGANIHVLPHVWFRNYWKHNARYDRPTIESIGEQCIRTRSVRNGKYHMYHPPGKQLFCQNETNTFRIHRIENKFEQPKDFINDVVTGGLDVKEIKENEGTKAAAWLTYFVPAGGKEVTYCRLSKSELSDPWLDFADVFDNRLKECREFYNHILPMDVNHAHRNIVQQALSGVLWTKSFYYLDVFKWFYGGGDEAPAKRYHKRNHEWQHLTNRDIISMPDKWEYPWYAAWDLAFHAISLVEVDPDYAKEQLLLMLKEVYMHPNGQIPAYEWNFSDVNPPVHSWAVWKVYLRDKEKTGKPDIQFLEQSFQKLLINFTWWVNQKDTDGNHLYEGGFLGLDNIGVFDRSNMPEGIQEMQQADATSWMAKFSVEMLRMAMELALHNPSYEDIASRFFRHFLNIGWSMHNIGSDNISLWDDMDAFYYDVVKLKDGSTERMKVRSLVGIIPIFAVEVIPKDIVDSLVNFKSKARDIIRTRLDLASLISRIRELNDNGQYLFSIARAYRLEQVLKRMLDEDEFLSEYGIRSLSKYHEENPFVFNISGTHTIKYEPGESSSSMFGGNSNWRGPIWLPLNFLIIESLRKYYTFYGPSYQYEFPTGSGIKLNLKEIADELSKRLLKLFEEDEHGQYRYHDPEHAHLFGDKEDWKSHLFYEFFNGDTGKGLGAAHQTGWTALIANLAMELHAE